MQEQKRVRFDERSEADQRPEWSIDLTDCDNFVVSKATGKVWLAAWRALGVIYIVSADGETSWTRPARVRKAHHFERRTFVRQWRSQSYTSYQALNLDIGN